MLTKDLIRARLSGDTVKPQFIQADDPDIRRYAEMGIQGILTDYPENTIAYNESVKKAGAR